jgi:hypothetical protein
LTSFDSKNVGSTSKHFLGYLNLVEPGAVPKVLEHYGKVIWHFLSVGAARNVVCHHLKSGAGVYQYLAVQVPILVDGPLAWELLLFLFIALHHRGPKKPKDLLPR